MTNMKKIQEKWFCNSYKSLVMYFGVSLYSTGCPGILNVDQAGFILKDQPASAS